MDHIKHMPSDEWETTVVSTEPQKVHKRAPHTGKILILAVFLLFAAAMLAYAGMFRAVIMPMRLDTGLGVVQDASGTLRFTVVTGNELRAGGVVTDQGQVWQASIEKKQPDTMELSVLIPAGFAAEANTRIRPFYWSNDVWVCGASTDVMLADTELAAQTGIMITQTPMPNGEVRVHLAYVFANLDTAQVYAAGFMLASGSGARYAVGEPSLVAEQSTFTLTADVTLGNGSYTCEAHAFSLTGNDSAESQPQRFSVQWFAPPSASPTGGGASPAQHTDIVPTTATKPSNPLPTQAPVALPAATDASFPTASTAQQLTDAEMPRASLFEVYAPETRFYYHGLTQAQKALFAELYDGIADFTTEVTLTGDHRESDLQPVLDVLRFDCPELFFLNRQEVAYRTRADTLVDVTFTYTMDQTEYEAEQALLLNEIKALALLPSVGERIYATELAIYQALIGRCEYQEDKPFASEGNAVWLRGYGECDGFTRGLHLALRYYGIPCGEVVGNTYDNGVISPVAHMWSYVSIDGTWYQCDVTWDNGFAQSIGDRALAEQCLPFFNIDDAMMMSARTRSTESLVNWPLPVCNRLADNYYNREGLRIAAGADLQTVLHERLTQAYGDHQNGLVLPFSNSADISTALVRLSEIIGQWRYQSACVKQYQVSYQIECNLLCVSKLEFSQ